MKSAAFGRVFLSARQAQISGGGRLPLDGNVLIDLLMDRTCAPSRCLDDYFRYVRKQWDRCGWWR